MTDEKDLPPQRLDVRLLSTANSSRSEDYEIPLNPIMRNAHMESVMELDAQISRLEEELKSIVATRKSEIKTLAVQKRRMTDEIQAGKLRREGTVYEIFFHDLKPPKAGMYDEQGNRVDWRYLKLTEHQRSVVIDAAMATDGDAMNINLDLGDTPAIDLNETDGPIELQH